MTLGNLLDKQQALLANRKNTRAELAAQLVLRNDEVAALREQLSVLRAAAPRTERKLPAHFVAAREMAMRTGRCVRVGA